MRWLRILPLVYLAMTVASLIYALVEGPFAAVYFIILTAPWSGLSIRLIDAVSPALMDQGAGIVTSSLGMLLNAWILHRILRWILPPTG